MKRLSREAGLQQACVNWFRYSYPKLAQFLIAVPNGGSRNALEAANLKRQGVVAGVSDLLLLIPRKGFGCLGMELKYDSGRQSDKQKQWEQYFRKAGNLYVIIRSVDQFIETVNMYLHENS